MNGAGAAEAAAAAELGADQIEVIAQHPEQRSVRINVELDSAVVDGERNHGHAGLYAAQAAPLAPIPPRGFSDEFAKLGSDPDFHRFAKIGVRSRSDPSSGIRTE